MEQCSQSNDLGLASQSRPDKRVQTQRTFILREPIFSFWNPLRKVLKAVYCGTLLGVIWWVRLLKRAHTRGIHAQPIQTGPPFPHPKDAPTTSHLATRTNTHRRARLRERVRRPRFTRTIRKHADAPSWPHRAGFQTLTRAVCGVGVWLTPPVSWRPLVFMRVRNYSSRFVTT